MISSTLFRKTRNIKTPTVGSWVKGKFTSGKYIDDTIKASIHIITGRELETLNIGQRNLGKIYIITNSELVVAESGTDKKGTLIQFNNRWYECIMENILENDIINYKGYYAELR